MSDTKNAPILLIDLADFSKYPDLPTRRAVLEAFQQILSSSGRFFSPYADPFKLWTRHGTGDGYYIVLKELPACVALQYARNIQSALDTYNKSLGDALHIRIRLTLDFGDTELVGDQLLSDQFIQAARLIDFPPFKQHLKDTGLASVLITSALFHTKLKTTLAEPDHAKSFPDLPALQWNEIEVTDKHHNHFKAFLLGPKWKELESSTPTPEKPTDAVGGSPQFWPPHAAYPLQPAPHFSGRKAELARLTQWATAPTSTTRVTALIAPGGTGKTALAHKTLTSLSASNPFGIFVWSFYTAPQTELFLQEAVRYFSRAEPPKEQGALLPALQHALSNTTPHLLILDGLELMQAETLPKGHLQNEPQLKTFLRWLAAGIGTSAKALITSRYPLPDLSDFPGFDELILEDLEPEAARALLLRRGVKGDDPTLDALATRFHHHALTLDVLGLHLARFHNGDPTKAPNISSAELKDGSDPKSQRLAKVLTHYAEKLPPPERDLLARLSLFPRGITLEYLGFLVTQTGEIAGALFKWSDFRLLDLLSTLQHQGLVFRSESPEGSTFSAHPFLRDFFRTLLGTQTPQQVHEALRSKLAPSLDTRPESYPSTPEKLDRYERLIEVTRLAGKIQEAFDLYWHGIGGCHNLASILGENARGFRIVSAFSIDNTPAFAAPSLNDIDRTLLITDWGVFASNLGDLHTAREAHGTSMKISEKSTSTLNFSRFRQNVAHIELLSARFPKAKIAAKAALDHAHEANDNEECRVSHVYFASAQCALGSIKSARKHFDRATKLEEEPHLYSLYGIYQSEFSLAMGNYEIASTQTQKNLKISEENNWTNDQARCHALLGHLSLRTSLVAARISLASARAIVVRSGHIEITLRCHHLAAEIARAETNHLLSLSEATAGLQLADSLGFGHWSILLRLELAKTHIAAGDPTAAIPPATRALELSEHPDCQYAWGIADAHHLLGQAHARLKDIPKARHHLDIALAKRIPLEHADLQSTKDELVGLPAT